MTGFCPIEIDGMVTSAIQFVQPMPLALAVEVMVDLGGVVVLNCG